MTSFTTFPSSIVPLDLHRQGGRPRKSQTRRPRAVNRASEDGDRSLESESDGQREESNDKGSTSLGGPALALGKPGEATLQQDEDGGWTWRWLRDGRTGPLPELSNPQEVFPGQQTADDQRRADRQEAKMASVRYLRTLPDAPDHIELRALMTDEMTEDERYLAAGAYDPFLGPRLATACFPAAHASTSEQGRAGRRAIFFPTGVLGQQLGIAMLVPSPKRGSQKWFCLPRAEALRSFKTPILQLDVVPIHPTVDVPIDSETRDTMPPQGEHLLLVRLHSAIHLFLFSPESDLDPEDGDALPVELRHIAELGTSDVRQRRIMDAALDPNARMGEQARVVLVDQEGGVWLWEPFGERTQLLVYSADPPRPVRNAGSPRPEAFYRIDFGSQEDTAILLTDREAILVELDFPAFRSESLLRLRGASQFVALGRLSSERGSTRCLVTMTDVVWIDEQKPGRAVLSWAHELGAGGRRDLELFPLSVQGHEYTVLSSRSHSLVLAYDVQLQPLTSANTPYPLAMPFKATDKPLQCLTALTLPLPFPSGAIGSMEHDTSSSILFGISPTGSVWSLDARPCDPDAVDQSLIDLRVKWDDALHELAAQSRHSAGDGDALGALGTKAERRHWTINARWAWLKINETRVGHDARDLSAVVRDLLQSPTSAQDTAVIADDKKQAFRTVRELLGDLEPNVSVRAPRSVQLRPLHGHINEAMHTAIDRSLSGAGPASQNLHQVAPFLEMRSASAERTVSLKEVYERLVSLCPVRTDLPAEWQRRRHDATMRLALDLYLSSVIRVPPSLETGPDAADPEAATIDSLSTTPEGLIARMSIREPGPPAFKFSFLPPKRKPASASIPAVGRPPRAPSEASFTASIVADPAAETDSAPLKRVEADPLQAPSARTLLSEWTLGFDPGEYQWTPYHPDTDEASRRPAQGASQSAPGSSRAARPIRPMPYSPGSQSQSQSQPQPQPQPRVRLAAASQPVAVRGWPSTPASADASGGGEVPGPPVPQASQVVPQLQLQSLTLDHGSARTGAIRGSRLGSMSSPPMGSVGDVDPMRMQTQVERGPFGGRPEGRKEKKTLKKKRAGGF